ncbi:MAG: hypothetical protein OXU44_00005, partial [Gammaproteobacteria bacterium]|nr:hypothetical protein [Gammaproteobacteria bacterium]
MNTNAELPANPTTTFIQIPITKLQYGMKIGVSDSKMTGKMESSPPFLPCERCYNARAGPFMPVQRNA